MMGDSEEQGAGAGGGAKTEASPEKPRHQSRSSSSSVILPQKERKNLIIELLKISLLAELHLHV